MIEMKRDLMRQMALRDASREVQEKGLYIPDQSILEQRDAMRESLTKPKSKRRIPWFTILTVATTIPFFMGDGGDKVAQGLVSSVASPQMVQSLKDPSLANKLSHENATVSVSFGGQTFEKKVTAQDVRAMQSKL